MMQALRFSQPLFYIIIRDPKMLWVSRHYLPPSGGADVSKHIYPNNLFSLDINKERIAATAPKCGNNKSMRF